MIPLEKELVKCKCICTLSAPSFLPGEIIICDFYKISGENFLRIYSVINGINFVIGALNKLHFDIPDWVPALGGKSFGFSIPELSNVSIPRLATGAVIPANKEFLAVLGDQKHGTNIEAPLDTIKQAQRESLMEVLSELGISGNSGNGKCNTYNIKALAHNKVLFELMIEEGKLQQMATGRNPFLLGTT